MFFYTRVQKSCKKKSNLINIDENYFTLWNNDGYKRITITLRMSALFKPITTFQTYLGIIFSVRPWDHG